MKFYRHIPLIFCFFCISFSAAITAAAAGPLKTAVTPGLYEIASAYNKDFVIDIKNCSVEETDGTQLQMYRTLDVNQQKFYFEALPGDICRISSVLTGSALTADTKTDDEAKDSDLTASVSMEPLQRSGEQDVLPAQAWIIKDAGSGAVYLQARSGKYLTLDDSRVYSGAPVCLRNFTGKAAQKWRLNKTWVSTEASADTDLVNPFGKDGPFRTLRLTLHLGPKKEQLLGSQLEDWYTITEDHQLTADSSRFLAYAEELASKYDTQGQPRTFTTSHGDTITLYKGNFGWKLDVEKTAQLLQESVLNKGSVSADAVWTHKGASFKAGDDIGDSYVEVDLTNQKVWLYKDGRQLLETDCVTGTYGTDRQTPGGVYSIYGRQSPAVLKGEGYASPVEYWMPFNGGIGLHDANWRGSFGGDIFRYDGSHGCINLPTDAARQIWETTDIGYPVVCYN